MRDDGALMGLRVSNQTRKSDVQGLIGEQYDFRAITEEIRHVHDQINRVIAQDAAQEDLASTATLAQTITKVNAILSTLRKAGLLKE